MRILIGSILSCRRRQRPNLSLYSNGAGHLRYYKRVAMAPRIALWSIVSALSFFGGVAVICLFLFGLAFRVYHFVDLVFALYSVQLVPQLFHVDVN